MALVGFIALLLAGMWLLWLGCNALFFAWFIHEISSRKEFGPAIIGILLGGVGAGLMWLAASNAPFVISLYP